MIITAFTGENSVRNRFFKFLSLATVLGLSLFLSSCFTLDTEFSIKKSGESTAVLTYTIDEEFISFWEGEKGSGYLLFPISKRDFKQRTLQVEGANLVTHKISNKKLEGKEIQIISAEISFDSPNAFNEFFNGDFTLNLNDDHGELKYSLYSPGKDVTPAALARVLDLVGDSSVSVKINTPFLILTHSKDDPGNKGKKDNYSVKVADLLLGDAAANISVKW